MVGFSTGGKNVSEVQRQWLLDYKKSDAAMAWNSGMLPQEWEAIRELTPASLLQRKALEVAYKEAEIAEGKGKDAVTTGKNAARAAAPKGAQSTPATEGKLGRMAALIRKQGGGCMAVGTLDLDLELADDDGGDDQMCEGDGDNLLHGDEMEDNRVEENRDEEEEGDEVVPHRRRKLQPLRSEESSQGPSGKAGREVRSKEGDGGVSSGAPLRQVQNNIPATFLMTQRGKPAVNKAAEQFRGMIDKVRHPSASGTAPTAVKAGDPKRGKRSRAGRRV